MAFLLQNGQETQLQTGDVITFETEGRLLSISRGTDRILPHVHNVEDNKCMLEALQGKMVDITFLYVCKLIANAAGLKCEKMMQAGNLLHCPLE